MKVKALTRSTSSYQAPGSDVARQPRNLDPALHPFERAREYTRSLNATKLERMFAKPFIGQLGRGHVDGVYSMAKDPHTLSRLASGSGDGVVKVWDLTTRAETWQTKTHENIVKGLCWTHDNRLLSCGGVDKTVALHEPFSTASGVKAKQTYVGKNAFTGLSHHQHEHTFAASHSAGISIYDVSRTAPITSLAWPTAIDTTTSCAFNPVETSLLASTATDRSIVLHDLRTGTSVARSILTLPANALSWNPMEAFNLAAASEDHNAYLFDTRNLSRALNALKDHVAAVTDVAFSPTGEDLVTASYDRTVRLWRRDAGRSRDVYHTKRMQRCFCAAFTGDAAYVLSGSDDGNVRLWRARAAERPGAVLSARERQARAYQDALKARYAHMPEVRRIARHRHVPKAVKKAGDIKRVEEEGVRRREENRRRHEKKTVGKAPRKSEREKMIMAVEE